MTIKIGFQLKVKEMSNTGSIDYIVECLYPLTDGSIFQNDGQSIKFIPKKLQEKCLERAQKHPRYEGTKATDITVSNCIACGIRNSTTGCPASKIVAIHFGNANKPKIVNINSLTSELQKCFKP